MHHCFDAASPPLLIPPHCDSVLGYIGGPSAFRKWTLEEWRRFGHLAQFPCYVADMSMSYDIQARGAVSLTRDLGWHQGRVIIFDLETQYDKVWWAGLTMIVRELGYLAMPYGSASTVLLNGAPDVWTAKWDTIPALQGGQTVQATQYVDNVQWDATRIDLSVVSDWLFSRAGQGMRQ